MQSDAGSAEDEQATQRCPDCGSTPLMHEDDPMMWRLADDEVRCLGCGANFVPAEVAD